MSFMSKEKGLSNLILLITKIFLIVFEMTGISMLPDGKNSLNGWSRFGIKALKLMLVSILLSK